MKKNKVVVHIAKTDINTDGRLLNEFQMIRDSFSGIDIQLILLPDKKVTIPHDNLFHLHVINCISRNSRLLRVFTVLEFTLKAFKILCKIKPDVVHAQDSAVSLPVLLYRMLHKTKFKLLYDDHEIPNENQNFLSKINNYFENTLIKKADTVLFANRERMEVLQNKLRPKGRLDYLLNLPFYEDKKGTTLSLEDERRLALLREEIDRGTRFIIHQGPIKDERGKEKLACFSKILPSKDKILLLGGNKGQFEEFVRQYKLDPSRFYFVGLVNYAVLSEYWKVGSASIVMYLPTYINNRLCAPNRLYLAYQNGLPIIVNKANPVLSNFITKYSCGAYIEDFNRENIEAKLGALKLYDVEGFEKLLLEERNKFINLYRTLLY